MSPSRLGIGIVGLAPARGWAAMVHVPALRALPRFDIVAVATTREDSAREAARFYDIPNGFGDVQHLIDHPAVDIVVVTVKAPHHHAIVLSALKAGKHVFCEWPLAVTLDEAIEMRDLARQMGVRHMIGLQSRGSPVVNHARRLIEQDFIGEILSCTMLSTVPNWSLGMDEPNAYTLDRRNGANILTVAGGHSLDMLCHVAGEFSELSARVAVRRTQAVIVGSNRTVDVTAPDQVVVAGSMHNGAPVAAHIQGGVPHATKFLMEINGSKGSLTLSDNGPLSAQMAPLVLRGAQGKAPLAVIEPAQDLILVPPGVPDGPPFNLAQLYMMLGEAIDDPARAIPDFDLAVRRHRLLAAIEAASDSGGRENV